MNMKHSHRFNIYCRQFLTDAGAPNNFAFNTQISGAFIFYGFVVGLEFNCFEID